MKWLPFQNESYGDGEHVKKSGAFVRRVPILPKSGPKPPDYIAKGKRSLNIRKMLIQINVVIESN